MIEQDPIDPLHQECIEARRSIRERFTRLREVAAAWRPVECPLPERNEGRGA